MPYMDVCNMCTKDSKHSANHTYFHPAIYFTFTLWETFSDGVSKSIGPKRRVGSSVKQTKTSFLVSCLSNHHSPAEFVILDFPYTTKDLSRYNWTAILHYTSLRTRVSRLLRRRSVARCISSQWKWLVRPLRPGCAGGTNCTQCTYSCMHARRTEVLKWQVYRS